MYALVVQKQLSQLRPVDQHHQHDISKPNHQPVTAQESRQVKPAPTGHYRHLDSLTLQSLSCQPQDPTNSQVSIQHTSETSHVVQVQSQSNKRAVRDYIILRYRLWGGRMQQATAAYPGTVMNLGSLLRRPWSSICTFSYCQLLFKYTHFACCVPTYCF